MAKKKSKQPPVDGSLVNDSKDEGQTTPSAASSSSTTRKAATPTLFDDGPALIICRNKHWRFISSFHGPWLQMSIDNLEAIANINYNTPRPRPVDPAVFFDLLKIRRLVDEATNLAVRAASDIASPTLTNIHGGMNGQAVSSLGFGMAGHGTKLSRERKFRMREQASQKLARAYRLDEIACSVATMQGASTLEEIGSLVLQRNPDDPEAKYVHFFHEKIPSRQLVESTSLVPLGDIIRARPTDAETWRTRATVRVFQGDHEGAAIDLTQALQVHRFHRPYQNALVTDPTLAAGRRPHDVVLTEEQQPSSLETQLFFQRAGVYLALSCQHIAEGLPEPSVNRQQNDANGPAGTNRADGPSANEPRDASPAEKEASRKALDHRKFVKTYAKRALRDYMAYLSHFDYAPNVPMKVTKEFVDKVNMRMQGSRHPRVFDSGTIPAYKTHSLADLFTAVSPSDMPPYPPQENTQEPPSVPSHEATTYHPLLTDALHSLLLCHCLIQTSAKELLRHAHMVARIARLDGGYPVFQPSRSPARADWLEVIRRANNWIQLTSSWDELCAPPPPLPVVDKLNAGPNSCHPAPDLAALAAAAVTQGGEVMSRAELDEQHRRERVRQQAIMESLEDDRVVDEATFRASVIARQNRAEEDHALRNGTHGKSEPALVQGEDSQASQSQSLLRSSNEDGKEYAILSDRAAAIARWVLDAPSGAGGTRRKKKGGAARKRPEAPGAEPEAIADELEQLSVDDGTVN